MKSDSEMPIQVSSTSTTPLLLPSMIGNDVVESDVMSGSNSSKDGSRTMGRPIVLGAFQTQNSRGGGTEIFGEHRKTSSDIFPDDSNEQQAEKQSTEKHPLSHQTHDKLDTHHDKTIEYPPGPAELTGNLSSTNTEFPPITQKTEEKNREYHLVFPTVERPEKSHYNRRMTFEPNSLQQQHVLAALPHLPQPPVQYTATPTPAEIALGTPSYGQSHEMGEVSRFNPMPSYTDLYRDSKRDVLSFQGKNTDEDASRTSSSTDVIITTSPGRMTPIHDNFTDRVIVGTPSTVSTAPSSDDEALLDYKLDETSTLPNLLHPIRQTQRSLGEDAMFSSNESQRLHTVHQLGQKPWVQQTLPVNSHNANDGATSLNIHNYTQQQHQPIQRVATFRNEVYSVEQTKNQTNSQRFLYHPLPKDHYSPQQFPYHQQQQQRIQTPQGNRKLSYAYHATPKSSTPPRSGRNQRQQGNRQVPSGGQNSSPHQPGSSSQRSSSEVLKTLLRKKACLYEPNTSRAVALVTWLVGRLLALEFGFFSRQQLQSGVHACVSSKIEVGTITRTKVNRCMQIILNSCFHYIIPRSDGTEEKGDYFREAFSETAQDDSLLLKELPEPWHDLVVDRDNIIHAIIQDIDERNTHQSSTASHSPSTSPKLDSAISEKNADRYCSDGEKEEASKRAVLLCFNENVRSAEDVFRCHNEFIRDTANASNLQLSAQEWSQFFGIEAFRDSYFKGSIGISMLVGASLGASRGVSSSGSQMTSDLLGRLSPDELGKFRTTWCTKRYEHDHDLCGFAHVEVNGGWLRRNPAKYSYKREMCKFVNSVGNDGVSLGNFLVNECPNGLACDHAHSMEEIQYHPSNYKSKVCTSVNSRPGGCRLGDVCPYAHPPDSNRPFKKTASDGRSPDKRGKRNFDQGKPNTKSWVSIAPSGSPIVYASPAPISSFEHQLGMPGLQNLYRRQSEVVRAYVRSSGKCQPPYSLFGDKLAISSPSSASK